MENDKKATFWEKIKYFFLAVISLLAILFVREKAKNKKTTEKEQKEKVKEDVKVVDTKKTEVKKTVGEIVKEAEKAKEVISKNTTEERLEKLEKKGIIKKKPKNGVKHEK